MDLKLASLKSISQHVVICKISLIYDMKSDLNTVKTLNLTIKSRENYTWHFTKGIYSGKKNQSWKYQ